MGATGVVHRGSLPLQELHGRHSISASGFQRPFDGSDGRVFEGYLPGEDAEDVFDPSEPFNHYKGHLRKKRPTFYRNPLLETTPMPRYTMEALASKSDWQISRQNPQNRFPVYNSEGELIQSAGSENERLQYGGRPPMNIYGEPIKNCGVNPWANWPMFCEYKTIDPGGHLICIKSLPLGFSAETGQNSWSDPWEGFPWCVRIEAFTSYFLANGYDGVELQCDAISEEALVKVLSLKKWERGSGGNEFYRAINRLCDACGQQAETPSERRVLSKRCEDLVPPANRKHSGPTTTPDLPEAPDKDSAALAQENLTGPWWETGKVTEAVMGLSAGTEWGPHVQQEIRKEAKAKAKPKPGRKKSPAKKVQILSGMAGQSGASEKPARKKAAKKKPAARRKPAPVSAGSDQELFAQASPRAFLSVPAVVLIYICFARSFRRAFAAVQRLHFFGAGASSEGSLLEGERHSSEASCAPYWE